MYLATFSKHVFLNNSFCCFKKSPDPWRLWSDEGSRKNSIDIYCLPPFGGRCLYFGYWCFFRNLHTILMKKCKNTQIQVAACKRWKTVAVKSFKNIETVSKISERVHDIKGQFWIKLYFIENSLKLFSNNLLAVWNKLTPQSFSYILLMNDSFIRYFNRLFHCFYNLLFNHRSKQTQIQPLTVWI